MAVAPFGSWPSPITAEMLLADTVSLREVRTSGGSVWWSEARPADGGRHVVVRSQPEAGDATVGRDALAGAFSARSRVHEYGGAAFTVAGEALVFVNDADQRIWRLDPGGRPHPLTAESAVPGQVRHADPDVIPGGGWLACVRERHEGPAGIDVHNEIVALALGAGLGKEGPGAAVVLAAGRDFYAAPRWSPDGRRLAWLCWDHPDMPWDASELWVAEVGPGPSAVGARLVAGGPDESVSQPRWSPDGTLHWASDRSGWWNLYAEDPTGRTRGVAPAAAEFSGPDWVFGQSSYTFLDDGTLVATWRSGGSTHLGVVGEGGVREVTTPFSDIGSVQSLGARVVAIAASPTRAPAVVVIDVRDGSWLSLRESSPDPLPAGAISDPEAMAFPTAGGAAAHAYFYRPRLDGYEGPAGALPPLLVMGHGGPTSATSGALNGGIQYWTSRGFAVVDVDYRGSTGYGREYRRMLDGQWGLADVEDCVNAARYLVARGEVDASRLAIQGSSAGGLTVMNALAFHDVFAVGASAYGVMDLEMLATDTHKFEARYLDRLVGPYPGAADTYRARSPIHAADRVTVPVILFHGTADRVVPPSQAEALVEALRANGVPHAYVTFEGEQHGFRQAANQKRALEAELWFFGHVLGFEPADDIEPVAVERPDGRTP